MVEKDLLQEELKKKEDLYRSLLLKACFNKKSYYNSDTSSTEISLIREEIEILKDQLKEYS